MHHPPLPSFLPFTYYTLPNWAEMTSPQYNQRQLFLSGPVFNKSIADSTNISGTTTTITALNILPLDNQSSSLSVIIFANCQVSELGLVQLQNTCSVSATKVTGGMKWCAVGTIKIVATSKSYPALFEMSMAPNGVVEATVSELPPPLASPPPQI